jgi:mannose-6-phosphate isomerase-like protein (cupin superfamily)
MQAHPYVKVPLLGRDLGTKETDFQVSEHEEPGAPPNSVRKIAPLHRHRSEDEAWYVLRGSLRFQFGQEEFDAPAGSGVLLPHGTPHTFWNASSKAARYLLIARPKTVALLETLHGAASDRSESVRDVFSRFDVDLIE